MEKIGPLDFYYTTYFSSVVGFILILNQRELFVVFFESKCFDIFLYIFYRFYLFYNDEIRI